MLKVGLMKFLPPTPPSSAIYSTKAGMRFTSLKGLSPTIPLNLSLTMSEASSTAKNVAPLKHYFSAKQTVSLDTDPETQPDP